MKWMFTVVLSLSWIANITLLECDAQEREFRPRVVMSADRFRPITEFPVVTAAEAGLDDHELILGVAVNGDPRAYPINMLTGPRREILNDTLGGTAIAATW